MASVLCCEQNLAAASQTLTRWHRLADPPCIEASIETRLPGERVRLFLSGGIDSLASLRSNLQRIPRSHPETISAAILVGGSTSESKFMRLKDVREIIAHEAGVKPIALRTNAQSLHNENMSLYINIYHGAFLADRGAIRSGGSAGTQARSANPPQSTCEDGAHHLDAARFSSLIDLTRGGCINIRRST